MRLIDYFKKRNAKPLITLSLFGVICLNTLLMNIRRVFYNSQFSQTQARWA